MEKKGKVLLTNEEFRKKYKSTFDLVNYAIQLAENMIKTGRDTRVKSDIQNRAMLILEEIREGKDQFDEIEQTNNTASENNIERFPLQKHLYDERGERRKFSAPQTDDD